MAQGSVTLSAFSLRIGEGRYGRFALGRRSTAYFNLSAPSTTSHSNRLEVSKIIIKRLLRQKCSPP